MVAQHQLWSYGTGTLVAPPEIYQGIFPTLCQIYSKYVRNICILGNWGSMVIYYSNFIHCYTRVDNYLSYMYSLYPQHVHWIKTVCGVWWPCLYITTAMATLLWILWLLVQISLGKVQVAWTVVDYDRTQPHPPHVIRFILLWSEVSNEKI